jgi:uncharacterized protein YjdB
MTRKLTLTAGATYQCRPLFMDQQGKPMMPAPATPTYTSSTPATATVSSTGLVTAVAAGTTTITATSGSLSTTLSVTVNAAPAPYTPAPTSLRM